MVYSAPPGGSSISYCWANTVNQYCYVATRPVGQTGDCVGSADPVEQCIKYRVSYRTEADPGTMQVMYTNW